MTEQDERTIYEWAYPELKGKVWRIIHKCSTGMTYAVVMDGIKVLWEMPIFRQDMNFAFDVCVPKLVSEGVEVTYSSNGEWFFDTNNPIFQGYFHNPDFYSALLAYIKEKPNA